MTRGSVAAVLVPGRPDSAGAQFFIVLADQPALDNQYTVFGHVSDGMEVLRKISETPVDAAGLATERADIRHVTIRDTPPEPFVTDSPQQLGEYRAVLETGAGPVTIEFFPDKAPEHVRQFLRLAAAGVYNGMAFHRVAPGIRDPDRRAEHAASAADREAADAGAQPSAGVQRHQARQRHRVDGARRRPASASTSFFICTGTSTALDGAYTAFGRVVDGMPVVEAIEASPRTGRNAEHADRAEDGQDRAK